eukprot:m.324602 g.324602  ORF g.324602 m.324602 type:complete len:128 (+) comp55540_c0_seq27:511-894(+)
MPLCYCSNGNFHLSKHSIQEKVRELLGNLRERILEALPHFASPASGQLSLFLEIDVLPLLKDLGFVFADGESCADALQRLQSSGSSFLPDSLEALRMSGAVVHRLAPQQLFSRITQDSEECRRLLVR